MKRLASLGIAGTIATGAFLVVSASPSTAETSMARGVTSCSQLRAQHPTGIAKSKKAAKAAVRAGYRKPFVCKHVYLQLKALDRNRNKSVCEVR